MFPLNPSRALIEATAEAFGTTADKLTGTRGTSALWRARFAAVWLLKHGLGRPDTLIARLLLRDRTTVKHALTRATDLRLEDDDYRVKTDRLLEMAAGWRSAMETARG